MIKLLLEECYIKSKMSYSTQTQGSLGFKDFLVFITSNGIPVSPFHNIPLYPKDANDNTTPDVVNMIVEIPKDTHYKLEINKSEFLNPIKHDIKNGNVRVIEMPFPAHYGAVPQTFEDPKHIDPRTNKPGDNDPLDVFDISNLPTQIGSITQLKVLGAYAAIDANETDWKLVGINIKDPEAKSMNDITDVSEERLDSLFTFLRDYKKPEGKTMTFAFGDKVQNKQVAIQVIGETHNQWKNLTKYGKSTNPLSSKEK
jgi:inorganic pyrophosphatase